MHDNERFAPFTEQARPRASKTPTLDGMGTDLTAQARRDKVAPVIGCDKDIERVIQVLSRSHQKNNVVLISKLEPGAATMAIVEGVAQRIISHRVPAVAAVSEGLEPSWLEVCLEKLQGKRLVTLNVGLLVAGTTSESEFEERFRTIIEELRSSQDCIIFIDEVHALIAFAQSTYGAAQGREDVAPRRVPTLARGAIQCIGATTLDEYREHLQNDPTLQSHFQEVIIHETIMQETILNQSGDNDSTQGHG